MGGEEEARKGEGRVLVAGAHHGRRLLHKIKLVAQLLLELATHHIVVDGRKALEWLRERLTRGRCEGNAVMVVGGGGRRSKLLSP